MKIKIGCSKNLIFLIIFILLLLGSYNLFSENQINDEKQNSNFSISELREELGNVKKIVIEGDKLFVEFNDGAKKNVYKESGISLSEYGITTDKVNIEVENPSNIAFWSTFFSIIFPFLIIGTFLYFMAKGAAGSNFRAMSFGKSKARLFNPNNKKNTSFNDVAGLMEAKQELQEIIEFLKNPEKFKKIGAEVPKGVLLMGPPGTGKTLMARAVAGEAKVPFFSISASEFVEMFVGVGASRVRDLFAKAKRNAPSVLFIDELDAIGRQRGTGIGGGHDEREQTLNQILVEMDGFENDTRVTVIAATNRPDVLDSALLRPGRFDRRVTLDLPDKKEREEIIKIHTQNKPLSRDISFSKISTATAGLSGADLKNIANEAAILVARNDRKKINQDDFNKAIEKVILGPERKSRVISNEEKKIIAYHEAGHALVGHILPNCNKVHKISLISRGIALGYTWSLPEDDRHLYSQAKFEDEIAQLLAGRVSEIIIFNELTTGAQNDLQRATKIAKEMVCMYGMSEKIGFRTLNNHEGSIFLGHNWGEGRNYSEKIATEVDQEIENIIHKAEETAKTILRKNRNKLTGLAESLIKREVIEGEELKIFLP